MFPVTEGSYPWGERTPAVTDAVSFDFDAVGHEVRPANRDAVHEVGQIRQKSGRGVVTVNLSPLAWSTSQGTGLPYRVATPQSKRDAAMMTLFPYLTGSTWVFDDARTGLKEEAFVLGMSEMISSLVSAKGLVDPDGGFALHFSDQPFDGSDAELSWLRSDDAQGLGDSALVLVGNWYTGVIAGERMVGWLCPALLKFFPSAPARIFVGVDSLPPGVDPIWHVNAADLPPRRFVSAVE